MFNIKIKEETFQLSNMSFLSSKNFNSKDSYPVIGIMQQKLLIANPKNGEMAELFPRNCIYLDK